MESGNPLCEPSMIEFLCWDSTAMVAYLTIMVGAVVGPSTAMANGWGVAKEAVN